MHKKKKHPVIKVAGKKPRQAPKETKVKDATDTTADAENQGGIEGTGYRLPEVHSETRRTPPIRVHFSYELTSN